MADRSTLISEVVARIIALVTAAVCVWLWLTGPAGPAGAFTAGTFTIGLGIALFTACAWMPNRLDDNVRRLGAGGLVRGFGFAGLALLAAVLYTVSAP